MTTIHPDRLFAKKTKDGYTWTLGSRLGDMLRLAQEFFGPRDTSYTILNVNFSDDGPLIWHLGNRKDIIIHLATQAAANPDEALCKKTPSLQNFGRLRPKNWSFWRVGLPLTRSRKQSRACFPPPRALGLRRTSRSSRNFVRCTLQSLLLSFWTAQPSHGTNST